MNFIKRFESTVAVVRTWNNKFVTKQVNNLLTMGVGKVIVVCNSTPDKDATKGFLGNLLREPRIQLVEMFEGYSWCNALNRALMAIQMANVKKRQCNDAEYQFVFNVSVEAGFTKSYLEQMLDVISDDQLVGVVGTSFEGRRDSNVISLGRSYRHPRNTGMLIKLDAFHFGGFDPRCDDLGMEDIDFELRIQALSNLTTKQLDLKVPLVVGVNYHQPTKEANERKAMDNIIAYWRWLFNEGTPERTRIDQTISEMGIEED